MSREIITFQLGHYSNFVGTHWWNIQEASFCYDPKATEKHLIDHDILFREGINPKGETTFTPRLIALDLRGSLGSLRQGGVLYESPNLQNSQSSLNWSGKVEVFKSENEPSNEFISDLHKGEESYLTVPNGYDADKDVCIAPRGSSGSLATTPIGCRKIYDLTDSVRVWSDYLRPHLHPRSVLLVDEFIHNDESNPFDSFAAGIEVYKDQNLQETIEDTLRRTAEECNQLQGFHVLMDSFDGFSGVSSKLLHHLVDEYPNKLVSVFPLCLPGYSKLDQTSEIHRLLTFLFSLESISQNSSIFSLLGLGQSSFETQQNYRKFPNITFKPELLYHTSAILAASLETVTLPMRTKSEPTTMAENVRLMTPVGRKCVGIGLCFPFPSERFLSETLESRAGVILTPLTPGLISTNVNSVVQSLVLNGIPTQRYYSQNETKTSVPPPIKELLVKSLTPQSSAQMNSVSLLSAPSYIPSTFPNILDSAGFPGNCESVAVLSTCQNTNSSAYLFHHLISESTHNVNKFKQFFSSNFDLDDLKETIETLTTFAECYDPSLFKVV